MKSNKVLLGVLAGVAAGAVIGILFAPEKGIKTRKKILRKGEDSVDELKEKFDEFLCSITQKYENAMQEADEFVSKGKTKYDEVKNEVHNGIA